MLPLGFVIFPYLVNLVFNVSFKKTLFNYFCYGFFFGIGFLLIFLCWIVNPFLVYQATQPYAILSFLLPIFLSIFFGLSFLIFKYLKNYLFLLIFTPFIFTFIEFFISNIFYGFPWITFSLILSNNSLGLYFLKYLGTFASSFFIIFLFILPLLFENINNIKKINKLFFLFSLPFVLVLIFPFNYYFPNHSNSSKQLSLDIHQILSPLNEINRKAVEQKIFNLIKKSESDFVIFAENNYPYLVSEIENINLYKKIEDNKKIIIGASREDNMKFYNSFLLFQKDDVQYFDKKILVPFGEFLPFRKNLKFMESIAGNFDFQIGKMDRILTTKDNTKILPVICYEIIFDQILKDINKKQIDVLINITNDSWFGNKVGPYQHFYITRIKSVIANKPIIRVSNNGISGIFDYNGKIIKYSKLNQEDNFQHNLKIINTISFHLIHKYLFYYIGFLFLIFFAFSQFKKDE